MSTVEIAEAVTELAELPFDAVELPVGYLGQQETLLESLRLSKGNWITCGNSLRPNWLNICPLTGTGND